MMIEYPSEMFVVEGRIQALRRANGTVNLVKDIQKGAWFTGLATGLDGQAGMLANAASLALYDGEDVEHVALLMNDELAVGTFEWLEDLGIDDEVTLVVSNIEDGPLFIHAILRKNDQLLWMPYSVARTRFSWMMHGVKICGVIAAGSLLIFAAFFMLESEPLPELRHVISLTVSLGLIMAFVGFMSTRGMMPLGRQAEDTYSALGVPLFEKFKLTPFSLLRMPLGDKSNFLKKGYIFKFDEALKSHKKKYKLS